MSTNERTGAEYLGHLARAVAGTPAVMGLYLADNGGSGRSGAAHLHLAAAGALRTELMQWLETVGETAYAAPTATGADVVTLDGLIVTLTVGSRPPVARWTTLFEREGVAAASGERAESATNDAEPDSAFIVQVRRFWRHLFAAAASLGESEPFGAHGDLEQCRLVLLDLYRMALAPGAGNQGYGGIDRLPGAAALAPLTEWLVAPLEPRAQWRCASRLAATYESLVLPLVERLGLDYPWALRNLAFRRLELVRPEAPQPADATAAAPAPGPAPVEPSGPAKFKVKLRRRAPAE